MMSIPCLNVSREYAFFTRLHPSRFTTLVSSPHHTFSTPPSLPNPLSEKLNQRVRHAMAAAAGELWRSLWLFTHRREERGRSREERKLS